MARVEDKKPKDGKQAPPNGDAADPEIHYEGRDIPRVDPPPPPAKPLFKRPRFLIVMGVILVVAAIGITWWWIDSGMRETTDDAFIAADSTSVSPRVAGHVVSVQVDDNQDVALNDVLVQIDPTDFDLTLADSQRNVSVVEGQLAQSRAQVSVMEANAATATAEVATAQANTWQAETDLKRYQALTSEAVSKQQLDAAIAAARSNEAMLDAAKKKAAGAEAQVAYARSEVTTAEAQLAKAKVAVEQAAQQRTYTTIRASIPGTITSKQVRVGDYVQTGQALLALVPHDVYIIANFKETQLTHMRPGQHVAIRIDSFPGRKLNGTVNSIQRGTGSVFSLMPPENATGNYVKVVQRVPVKIVFDSIPSDLRLAPGMSVEPDVELK